MIDKARSGRHTSSSKGSSRSGGGRHHEGKVAITRASVFRYHRVSHLRWLNGETFNVFNVGRIVHIGPKESIYRRWGALAAAWLALPIVLVWDGLAMMRRRFPALFEPLVAFLRRVSQAVVHIMVAMAHRMGWLLAPVRLLFRPVFAMMRGLAKWLDPLWTRLLRLQLWHRIHQMATAVWNGFGVGCKFVERHLGHLQAWVTRVLLAPLGRLTGGILRKVRSVLASPFQRSATMIRAVRDRARRRASQLRR